MIASGNQLGFRQEYMMQFIDGLTDEQILALLTYGIYPPEDEQAFTSTLNPPPPDEPTEPDPPDFDPLDDDAGGPEMLAGFGVWLDEPGFIVWQPTPPAIQCAHSCLAETGFGSAYCLDCDAKLVRGAQLEWVVKC